MHVFRFEKKLIRSCTFRAYSVFVDIYHFAFVNGGILTVYSNLTLQSISKLHKETASGQES
uniref:Uncharacterized protein n=1 Tax=Nelumbo nucifera TaxID=4432 RepID=A0A822Y1B0_NELNU|nr:TPA_asm: hypothetical protein HUJ06_026319 [Nelumbo nucifera]